MPPMPMPMLAAIREQRLSGREDNVIDIGDRRHHNGTLVDSNDGGKREISYLSSDQRTYTYSYTIPTKVPTNV